MKCFYHTDKPAVAQCNQCGRYICRDCAVDNLKSIYCGSCIDLFKKESEREAIQLDMQKKNQFIISVVIFAVSFFLLIYIGIENSTYTFNLVRIMIQAFMLAGVPYGWKSISKFMQKFNFILVLSFVGWYIFFVIKLLISLLVGWVFLAKDLFKRFKKGIELNGKHGK